MAKLVTTETKKSVSKFLNSLKDESQRKDAKEIAAMLKKITGKTPKIWGDNFIIGYGKYTYKRKGGKDEFEWFNVGFAPRKSKITLYVTYDVSKEKALLKKLGPCTYGKGCLHIKNLDSVDVSALKKILTKSKSTKWSCY